eukprot:m.200307 g.200307  ORF g.200307 m.200307 type:complete len:951 (+) comp17051_c0_seq3:2716-5568(+)
MAIPFRRTISSQSSGSMTDGCSQESVGATALGELQLSSQPVVAPSPTLFNLPMEILSHIMKFCNQSDLRGLCLVIANETKDADRKRRLTSTFETVNYHNAWYFFLEQPPIKRAFNEHTLGSDIGEIQMPMSIIDAVANVWKGATSLTKLVTVCMEAEAELTSALNTPNCTRYPVFNVAKDSSMKMFRHRLHRDPDTQHTASTWDYLSKHQADCPLFQRILTTLLLSTDTKYSACRFFEAMEASFGPVLPRRAFAMAIIGLKAMHMKEECATLAVRLEMGMELSLLSWAQVAANSRVDIDLRNPHLNRLWQRSTLEQKRVCIQQLGRGDILHVAACAGTGKTTTLQLFTAMRSRSHFLNLCYNVAVNERAKATFDHHVENRTIHSLIESLFMMHYDKAVMPKITTMTAARIRKLVEQQRFVPTNHYCVPELIQTVKITYESFMNTVLDKVETVHYSFDKAYEAATRRVEQHRTGKKAYKRKKKPIDQDLFLPMTADDATKWILDVVNALWVEAQATQELSHDGYIKYMLRHVDVVTTRLERYDCILIDEAQDLNECMLKFLNASQVPQVYVGDPAQQLYRWRKSVNVFKTSAARPATATCRLTQSFRFSEEVAHAVRSTLNYKDYAGTAIRGTLLHFTATDGNSRATIQPREPATITKYSKAVLLPDIEGVQALLCRRNAEVLKLISMLTIGGHGDRLLCLGASDAGPAAAKGRLEGIDHFYMDKMCKLSTCACQVLNDSPISGPAEVQKEWFQEIQETAMAIALSTYADCFSKGDTAASRAEFQELLDTLENTPSAKSSSEAKDFHPERDVYLSTVHQTKGDEFEAVQLTDGLPEPEKVASAASSAHFGNADVMYVAMTRAKAVLSLPGPWHRIYQDVIGRQDCYISKHCTLAADRCSRCEVSLEGQLCAVHCPENKLVCVACLAVEQADQANTTTPDALELMVLMNAVS